ncbi:ABC transporter permease [Crossiella sp. NPDC003009]
MNALLLRLTLRRVWVRCLSWGAAIGVLMIVGIAAYQEAFPDPAQRAATIAALAGQPALYATLGAPGDIGSLGGFVTWRMGQFECVVIALFAMLTLAQLTRGDEENGLREALWAGAVRRTAPLSAALLVVGAGTLLLGAVITTVMLAEGTPALGAVLFGAACAGAGLAHLGIAALASQLATSRRAVSGLTGAALATGYVLRTLADANSEVSWLRWLSPLGWAQRVDAYTTNRAWPLLLLLGLTALTIAAALAMEARRDLGAGLLHARPGPAHGRSLRVVELLTLRLHTGAILGWALGLAVLAASIGAIVDGVSGILAGNSQLGAMLAAISGGERRFTEAFLATLFQIIGLLIALVAAQAVVSAREQERTGQAEVLLARPLTRARWLGAHLLTGLLAATLTATVAGSAAALSWWASGGHDTSVLVAAALNTLPAAAVFAGLATLLIAVLPRWAATLGTLLPMAGFVLALFGPLAGLPAWLLDVSPFRHQALLPAQPFDGTSALALLGVAALFAAAGLVLIQRRDLRIG